MAKANPTPEFSRVYRAALESKYQGSNVDNILQIIYSTSNPEIAMELLLNIYEHPVIEQNVINSSDSKKLSFISYDMFNKRVRYSYETNKSVGIYVKKGTNTDEITHENYQDYKTSWNHGETDHFSVVLPDMETIHDEMGLSTWEKCQKWYTPQIETVQYCLED
jgi:hypothetical protein